jgi:hypothetical protein
MKFTAEKAWRAGRQFLVYEHCFGLAQAGQARREKGLKHTRDE